MTWNTALLVFVILPFAASPKPVVASTGTDQSHVQSRNFIVRSLASRMHASHVAEHCESVCQSLRENWLDETDDLAWKPKCQVVLHSNRRDYLNAVGSQGTQTVGSSLVQFDGGRVVARRIDLLAESREGALSALRHEMIHILCAHRFPKSLPPRWAEEGLALLQDSADKQARHISDLSDAFRNRSTIPLEKMLSRDFYPIGNQRAAFYAQSLSLVSFLSTIAPADQFTRFVDLCLRHGNEYALREVYGIQNLSELDRRWRASVYGNRRESTKTTAS